MEFKTRVGQVAAVPARGRACAGSSRADTPFSAGVAEFLNRAT
jgi:hypothetical protein